MKRFLKILNRLKPYKYQLGLSIFFNILMAIFTIAGIPLFIPFFELIFYGKPEVEAGAISGIKADLVNIFGDLLIHDDPQTTLKYIIFLILVIFILKNLFRYLAHYFIAPVRNGFLRDLRQELFDHLISLPVQFYKQNKKGDLLSRMSMDIQETENSILNILETLIKSPLLIIGSLSFMFYVSYELTLLVLFLIPFTILVIGGLSRTLKKQSSKAQEKLGQLMSILEEAVSGVKIVKSFNAQNDFRNRFHTSNDSHKFILTRILRRKDLGSPLAEVLAVGVIASLMYYAAKLVFNQALSPDTFFAFIYAFFIIIEPAKSFSSAYYSYKKGDAALERLESIFNTKSSIRNSKNAIPLKSFNDKIEFRKISFAYPDDPNNQVLKEVSFEILKGQKIAVIGSSGAGKSTLADLLPRFMDYDSGELLIDGNPIALVDIEDLRNLIAIVTQDPILFNDTISNNISFGRSMCDEKDIVKSAEIANIDDFVRSLPNAYNHFIGDQGGKLSGGQKQRIAIARAVLKDAPILILDEATSSLDSESEKKVQFALNNMLSNKTALIIAHRLSTIREADKILVLDQGVITESGNHEELMEIKGEYYKFVQLQSLKYNWND